MKSKNKIYEIGLFVILILSSSHAFCSSNSKDSKKVKDGWSEAYGFNTGSKIICPKKLILDVIQKDCLSFSNEKSQIAYLDYGKWSLVC